MVVSYCPDSLWGDIKETPDYGERMSEQSMLTADDLLPFERGGESADPMESLFEFAEAEIPDDGDAADTDQQPDDDVVGTGESELDGEDEPESDEDNGEQGSEEPDDSVFEVEDLQGETHQATLAELADAWRKRESFESDYTRKTAELAKERRELRSDLGGKRDQYAEGLEKLTGLMQRLVVEPDWARLRAESPEAYAEAHDQYQRARATVDELSAELDRVRSEAVENERAEWEHVRTRESERLHEVMGWDPASAEAKQAKQSLATYAMTEYDFTEQELGNVVDHRLLVILDKARQWDALQRTGKETVQKKAEKAKVLEPGAKRVRGPSNSKAKKFRAARERLGQTGRVKDAAEVLIAGMPDDFWESSA